jgi:hypothetical protein
MLPKKSNVWSKATYVSTCAGWVNITGCREVGKVYLSFVVGAGAIVSPRCTSCVCFMLLLVIFFDFVACWGE